MEVNMQEEHPTTNNDKLLIEYTKNKNIEKIKELLDQKADPNSSDEMGTLLFHSTNQNQFFVFQCNSIEEHKKQEKETLELVELLLKYKADANQIEDRKSSSLDNACKHIMPSVVKLLLNHIHDVNRKSLRGDTPLITAVYKTTEIEDLMPYNNQDLEGDLYKVFRDYHNSNCKEIIQLLCSNGAHINVPNNYGVTPLFYTITHKSHLDLLKLLLELGADTNQMDSEYSRPIHNALYKEQIELLLKYGANINATNKVGDTILHKKVIKPTKLVDFLIESKANVYAKNNMGKTALDMAQSVYNMTTRLAENSYTRDYGNDINTKNIQIYKEYVESLLSAMTTKTNSYNINAEV